MNEELVNLAMSPATRDLVEALGFRLVIYHPVYGVHGQPYVLAARKQELLLKEGFWTSQEALDRRDELLEDGFEQVIVVGLPSVIAIGGVGGGA